jgi:hypothetical protein
MTLPTIKKALEILKEQRLIEFSILNGNIPEVDEVENCGARLLSPEEILHLGNALMTPSFFFFTTTNEAELLDSIEQVIKASFEVRTKEAESLREVNILLMRMLINDDDAESIQSSEAENTTEFQEGIDP